MAWMKKKMGCKADGEDEYRSNLSVVRISSNHPTQSARFFFATPYPSRPVSATYLTSSTVLLIFNFRKILAL